MEAIDLLEDSPLILDDFSSVFFSEEFVAPALPNVMGIQFLQSINEGNPSRKKSRFISCTYPGCTKHARSKKLCGRHGGGKKCSSLGCANGAKDKSGLCIRHGGRSCKEPNCKRGDQGSGYCKRHCKVQKFCTVSGCYKREYGKKLCRDHGGGKRCKYDGCQKGYQRFGYCSSHFTKEKSHLFC